MVNQLLQYFALQSKCCAADRALFPGDINAFIKNNNSRGLSDWILGNKGWIAASIKRRENGDLGSIPIIDWVATEETNDADKINRVKENRRQQVLVEEERKERKKAKQRQKRQNKKSKTNQNKNEPFCSWVSFPLLCLILMDSYLFLSHLEALSSCFFTFTYFPSSFSSCA